ncbi:hypothetical protein ACTOS9_21950 (plasmid) [Bacillus subtilis]
MSAAADPAKLSGVTQFGSFSIRYLLLQVFHFPGAVDVCYTCSVNRKPSTFEGNYMGKKDGKPEPNDIGNNMKITISKKSLKEIKDNQNNKKK